MATFLDLVKDAARQSGTLAEGPAISSVEGVSGRADKIVYWVKEAYSDIQNKRKWNFLRGEYSGEITAGTARYTGVSFNLTRLREFVADTYDYCPHSILDSDGSEPTIVQIPYAEWRARYDRGTHTPGRPICYALAPNGQICLGPTPNATYTMRGEYWKTPHELVANTDVPEIPAHLHRIIVWQALLLMAASDEVPIAIQMAQSQYNKQFRLLCQEQLPSLSLGGNTLV